MAKDIIEKIKEAEAKGRKTEENAVCEAEKLASDAKAEASAFREEELKRAAEEAGLTVSSAVKASEALIRSAEEEALKERAELRNRLYNRMDEAARDIIASLAK